MLCARARNRIRFSVSYGRLLGGHGLLLKNSRLTSDLIGTGKRPQREIFEALDKMREEDARWEARRLRLPIYRRRILSQGPA
jgi:hypothetical protein